MNTLRPALIRTLLAAAALITCASAHAGTKYQLTDLGTFGGNFSEANGINNQGQITGRAAVSGSNLNHAFLYTPGVGMQDLGTLGGQVSNAYAVNNLGEVAGHTSNATGDTISFVYRPGSGLLGLGNLGGSNDNGVFALNGLNGINDSGRVVGWSSLSNGGVFHAVSDAVGGPLVDLGTLGGNFSNALGVNAQGTTVGWATTDNTDAIFRATVFGANGVNQDLGTLGGSFSYASDVNDNGVISGGGWLVGDGSQHAFTYTAATGLVDLGTLGGANSFTNHINNLGQVVGGANDATGATQAFVYTPGQGMLNLSTSLLGAAGWTNLSVSDINDKGQIVGSATFNGEIHAVLLDPTVINAVPEPETYALMLLGLVAVAGLKRRQRAV